jgi:hypothetical protein
MSTRCRFGDNTIEKQVPLKKGVLFAGKGDWATSIVLAIVNVTVARLGFGFCKLAERPTTSKLRMPEAIVK